MEKNNNTVEKRCPKCNEIVNPFAVSCPNCGERLVASAADNIDARNNSDTNVTAIVALISLFLCTPIISLILGFLGCCSAEKLNGNGYTMSKIVVIISIVYLAIGIVGLIVYYAL